MLKATVLASVLMCSVCSGFLINQTDLLMYFREVSVSLPGPNVEPDKVERVYYNSTNTVVNYNVDSSEDKKTISIALDFTRTVPIASISTFQMMMTLTSNPNMYWRMNNATATLKGSSELSADNVGLVSNIFLEAPLGQSFSCSKFGKLYPDFRAKVGNVTPVIEFLGLQVQAFNVSAEGKFGDAWDCVGFFSIGIWSGIFISAILIAIITWGLAMIMDVKTMDRFDDPKGKPISFGGAE